MTKRKKQAIILLTLSVPMMWWGLGNIISETPSSNILSIMISVSTTFGGLFAISGLVMLVTKNSLGIWDIDDKGRGEGLLVSQTTVKDSPIQKEIINKKQKVNEMAEAKDTVANTVKEVRELEGNIVQSEEIIKKETLNVKTTTEKIAVLKHNLAKDKTVKELLAIITD